MRILDEIEPIVALALVSQFLIGINGVRPFSVITGESAGETLKRT